MFVMLVAAASAVSDGIRTANGCPAPTAGAPGCAKLS